MAVVNTSPGKSKQKNATLPYMYLLPAFLVMGVITFYPLIYQVIISFTNFESKDLLLGLKSPELEFIGFKNYLDIFTAALPVENFNFFRVLEFNFWWALSNVILHVPTGVLVATLLNTEGLWLKRIYRAIYVLPVVVPPLVVATVWTNIFDERYGAMNQLLTNLSIAFFGGADPIYIRWFEDVKPPIPGFLPGAPLTLAYYAMMVANFWLGWPFMSVVATGALQSIPKDLYEAASIDGATGSQQFWGITVPLLRPAMIPAAVYGFTLSFNLFNFVFFMTGGGPARSTELLVTFAYNLVRNLRWYGVAAAFAVIIFVVALVVFMITNRITRATQNYQEA